MYIYLGFPIFHSPYNAWETETGTEAGPEAGAGASLSYILWHYISQKKNYIYNREIKTISFWYLI